jgi:hypothetical protein
VEAIQDVGAYAGFAAVIGLAVLAALYFSQARDVRRLREWAGRAPERAAEQAVQSPEQAAQEATRPAASGAVKAIPAAKPATPGAPAPGKPATAAGAEGKPAGAPAIPGKPDEKKPATAPGAAPPVPATAAAAAKATPGVPAPATAAAAPAKDKPASDGPADGTAPAPKPATAAAGTAPATSPPRPPAPRPVLPPRPAPPVRSPAAASAASQSTAVLPAPSARLRDRARGAATGRDGLGARYIALIVAGVIVVGGGVAFGVSQLGGDDEAGAPDDRAQTPAEPVNPSTVTVSVLNGTTVPGLAAQIGDEVESQGFQRGNVANALDQQRTESTVLFGEGAEREAQLVARRLDIATVEPVDPDSQALGGTASVVVIVGADQTQ